MRNTKESGNPLGERTTSSEPLLVYPYQTHNIHSRSLVLGRKNCIPPTSINTGANGLQRLDAVVRAAEKHGIKLIIPFVNNWSDYGGIPAYNTYFNTTSTTWFTNTAAQAQYRKYIKAVVSRYKTSEAIFAWELGNEPRCQGCVTSVITNWAKGNIDFGTFHLYPISWGITTDHAAWGKAWFANHGDICAKVGKPCLAEEFGATTNKTGILPIWQRQALDHPAIGGDMYWQYALDLETLLDQTLIDIVSWLCYHTLHLYVRALLRYGVETCLINYPIIKLID
ncbi:putative mannan endo-1,4-beta-mannosidase A [Glarea lozoyensis 74030]|uniref:mannan endo-1,4-beta-mannosidase n=1 Tax=Glarea lozoyensis (strain ATCC 74030 / MF5533) TaxID=1104152 RepID=H0EM82_GLAL7|nr:putative mannan endo-1,4-beta-mannosidase A [Glarea lozoyensis 74030]